MSLPPVTEEDKPAVESIILRLKRIRKREHMHGSKDSNGKPYVQPTIDDAINNLMEYGELKGWWKYEMKF